jgi:AcrR family transcriptional regulator
MAPRTEEQNQQIRDERREEILTHAMHVFAKKGFCATKISDVAASAGLSPGLVYHYFESKEDMFVAVISQSLAITNSCVKKVDSLDCEPIEKLRLLTLKALDDNDEQGFSIRWQLILQICVKESIPQKALEFLNQNFQVLKLVASFIKEGQKRGQISTEKDADMLTTAYWALMQGLVFLRDFEKFNDTGGSLLPDIETIFKLFK